MILAEPANPPLFRWSTERYMALIESGIIAEGPGVELIDGCVVEVMPQGELHRFLFVALQRVFESMQAFRQGMEAHSTVLMSEGNVFDPEFALLNSEAVGQLRLPKGSDLLFVVEVSVTSLPHDLGVKKTAYASAGIPNYWVVDGLRRGIHACAEPVGGIYRSERFFSEDESIGIPELGHQLAIGSIFPPTV